MTGRSLRLDQVIGLGLPREMSQLEIEHHCDMLAKSGSEHGQQRAFFAWLAFNKARFPLQHLAFAIPNGGLRDKITAAKLKAEGVKAGVLDIFYPSPIGEWRVNPGLQEIPEYHGLFIEMKTDDGRVSEDQADWIAALLQEGYAVAVCWSWRAAAQAFTDYNQGRPVLATYRG